jgi:hypothetical protein
MRLFAPANFNREDTKYMSAFKPRTRDGSFLFSVILTTAKMLFIVVLILGITGTGLLVGVAKAWIETAPALDLSSFGEQAKTSFIYDKNGDLITAFKGTENRIDATWDEIPENLKNAVIAIEDQRFRTHNGVDIKRILGALVTNLLNDNVQGGSTITQQLVKLTMLTTDQNYKRKLQEAYLALQRKSRFQGRHPAGVSEHHLPGRAAVTASRWPRWTTIRQGIVPADSAECAALARDHPQTLPLQPPGTITSPTRRTKSKRAPTTCWADVRAEPDLEGRLR